MIWSLQFVQQTINVYDVKWRADTTLSGSLHYLERFWQVAVVKNSAGGSLERVVYYSKQLVFDTKVVKFVYQSSRPHFIESGTCVKVAYVHVAGAFAQVVPILLQ